MAKKLSEDYIRFTLSLSTSEAQQEIRKLEKASNIYPPFLAYSDY